MHWTKKIAKANTKGILNKKLELKSVRIKKFDHIFFNEILWS